jgi:hypothetical protein
VFEAQPAVHREYDEVSLDAWHVLATDGAAMPHEWGTLGGRHDTGTASRWPRCIPSCLQLRMSVEFHVCFAFKICIGPWNGLPFVNELVAAVHEAWRPDRTLQTGEVFSLASPAGCLSIIHELQETRLQTNPSRMMSETPRKPMP